MDEKPTAPWEGYISPDGLRELVWNTAPFLRERAEIAPQPATLWDAVEGPDGYLTLYHRPVEDLTGYFALCLACHHGTVATYVPTDVDTKIRGLLWRDTAEKRTLREMADLGISMHIWSLEGISKRVVDCGVQGLVSGHDGEWLSVISGAHGRFLALGDAGYADLTFAAIDEELKREGRAFAELLAQPGREIDTLRLAMSVIHNLGDLNQGISFWSGPAQRSDSAKQFGRLAQENVAGYGGAFRKPAELYKELLASEGHRHYPLRGVKALRRSPELLLPLGPFLDDYGATLAATSELNAEEKAEVLEALVRGCKKVPGQMGYYRAIAGFREASTRVFDESTERMASSAQRILREPEMRQKIAVPRRSFESSYIKRVEQIRGSAA